jgi:hypothetical protein
LRRRNPFALLGPISVVNLAMFALIQLPPWTSSLPGPFEAVRSGLSAEAALGVLLLSASLIAAWVVAGVVVRLRTREEEQFDRDRMYPPAAYWEGSDD